MHEDNKPARIMAAATILGGMYAGRWHEQPEDLADPVGAALDMADDLVKRVNDTSWSRPGDSRSDGQRDRQHKNIADAQAARAETPPEDADGASPALRDLGVSGRACAPLERMDIETVEDLSCYRREAIEGVKGVSKDTLKMLDKLLVENGHNWLGEEDFADSGVEDGDDPEDVL